MVAGSSVLSVILKLPFVYSLELNTTPYEIDPIMVLFPDEKSKAQRG